MSELSLPVPLTRAAALPALRLQDRRAGSVVLPFFHILQPISQFRLDGSRGQA